MQNDNADVGTSSDAPSEPLPAATFEDTSFSAGDSFDTETAAPPKPTDEPVEYRLQFTGSGSEYFRIWIVNLCLSILTLGIYSPWAKVRREQYFHRNTLLNGSGFDYHGKPIPILKGRIIAYGLIIGLAILERTAPDLYFPALILVIPIVPWLLVRSFSFRARNTSWRGIRFNFSGTYLGFCKTFWSYALVFLLAFSLIFFIAQSIENDKTSTTAQETQEDSTPVKPCLRPDATAQEENPVLPDDATAEEDEEEADDPDEANLSDFPDSASDEAAEPEENEIPSEEGNTADSLMLMKILSGFAILAIYLLIVSLIPALYRQFNRFLLNHLSFGSSRFDFSCGKWPFYRIFLIACIPSFFGILALFIVGIFTALFASFLGSGVASVLVFAIIFALSLLVYLGLIIAGIYFKMGMTNLVWNNTQLGEEHRIVSDQKLASLLAVVLLNYLLIGLTLGFFWPWAKVRMAEYRARHTALVTTGNLEEFIGQKIEEQGAAGAELMDAFDFDVAI